MPSRKEREDKEAQENQDHNKKILLKLLFFTVLMFTVPIATFYHFRDWVGQENPYANAISAGAAVVSANLIVALYCIMAYYEHDKNATKYRSREEVPAVGRFKKD